MGLGDELVELAVGACHRCETPLHLLRRNLVEKMADSDRVSELFGRFALQGVVALTSLSSCGRFSMVSQALILFSGVRSRV